MAVRNYFVMHVGSVYHVSCSIFFEPEVFFCKPGELSTKENGGVALLKGKKVWRKYFVQKTTHILWAT